MLKETKNKLSKKFEMVNLNEIQYCLKIQINRLQQDQTIYWNQNKYFKGRLKQFGMAKTKHVEIIFMTNCKLLKDMGP